MQKIISSSFAFMLVWHLWGGSYDVLKPQKDDVLRTSFPVLSSLEDGFVSPVDTSNCFDFTAIDPAERFPSGSTITAGGLTGTFDEFFFLGGGSTTGGPASISNNAGGRICLFMPNMNLTYEFTPAITSITFEYFEAGGNVNLIINGNLLNSADMVDFNGQTVDGVSIQANANFVCLTGNIQKVSIGGQEFFLCRVCPEGEVPPPTTKDCVEFKDIDPSTTYSFGSSITSEGLTGIFNTFFFSNGNPFNGGSAGFSDFPGTGEPCLFISNLNLTYNFNRPLDTLKFCYRDLGGNVNLIINGILLNSDDFTDFDGLVVDGVIIDASTPGMVCLIGGNINSVGIGGQELFLTKVCPCPQDIPPPPKGYCDSTNTFFGFDSGINNLGICNTFYGANAGKNNTTGESNTFVGGNAGRANTTGLQNTFLGKNAGARTTTGLLNTFVGFESGQANITGSRNTFLGSQTGQNNTGGVENTFFGYRAGRFNTSGGRNVFIGNRAGEDNTTGSFNMFLGAQAGIRNVDGIRNTYLGYEAGSNGTSSERNVYIGYRAGKFSSAGGENVFLGHEAGNQNINGSGNVFLGNRAGYFETGSNKLYIDNRFGSTPLVWGDFRERVVGINTKEFMDGSDKFTLSVAGKMRAEEVKVYTGWADFVFEDDYDLRSLEEVENYIREHGHLPEVPSEEEVSQKGIFLGKMNATLLQKIEELTLYTIEQEKRDQVHQEEIQKLKDLVALLQVENQELKSLLAKILSRLENVED